ncbi:hypothetical protein NGA_0686200, partial [Nannochloropsis gaditana CCMP526]|uniref:uncharacterized protein n=1 Tax=Nannochloropsis gaditana (strain CCMP526) TaxID=1093141 RepID=UPI00029F6AD4
MEEQPAEQESPRPELSSTARKNPSPNPWSTALQPRRLLPSCTTVPPLPPPSSPPSRPPSR